MATFGWVCLIVIDIWVFVMGVVTLMMEVGFTGKVGWRGPVILAAGLTLAAVVVRDAPFEIVPKMGVHTARER